MTVNEILIALGEKYAEHTNGDKAWANEKKKVKKLLSEIKLNIAGRYEIQEPIGVGGTGIVLKVVDRNLGIPRALKFPRPLVGKELLLIYIMESEIARLIESAHENIVSIYYRGEVEQDDSKWPFYVMEYIEGAVDGKVYLINLSTNDDTDDKKYEKLVKLIQQVVNGLTFIHSREMIHCDVKLENILVAQSAKAKISDFGSARLLDPTREEDTQFFITKFYAHPHLLELAPESSGGDPDMMRGKIRRSQLKKKFDVYALGKNILRILYDERKEGFDTSYLRSYERQYLVLMACRMLDGFNNLDNERCLKNLPRNGYEEIKYTKIEQVALDIKKLIGEYSIHQSIKELDHHFPETIQVTSPGTTSFPKRVSSILKSPLFRRLAGVSQLGFIIQIYPSASHSRLEHVLGTFANVARYCDALWNDPVNPLFRQIVTEHDVNLVLLTALCHDIGQYPLAHDFEGAEKQIFSHKKIGRLLLTSDEHPASEALRETMRNEWGVEAAEVVELLDTRLNDYNKPFKLRLLHSLIDGPIDADKLDYIVRDSNHLNVPYGTCIDSERLLKCLTVILSIRGAEIALISLGIHYKGRVTAESVAFARYAMFTSVYWHHTSRSAKSMLHRAIWEALDEGNGGEKMEVELKAAFREEIIRQVRTGFTEQQQEGLFPDKIILTEIPQLALSDYQILVWLSRHTSELGEKLLQMICERKLFKRLKVLDYRAESDLWDNLIRFRVEAGWKRCLEFQRTFQANLIDSFKPHSTKEAVQKIEKCGQENEVLFLVDIPIERKPSSISLQVHPECREHGPVAIPPEELTMRDSVVWSSLEINFLKSVGKIRVLCHPDIIAECSTCFAGTELIEATLKSTYEQVVSS